MGKTIYITEPEREYLQAILGFHDDFDYSQGKRFNIVRDDEVTERENRDYVLLKSLQHKVR